MASQRRSMQIDYRRIPDWTFEVGDSRYLIVGKKRFNRRDTEGAELNPISFLIFLSSVSQRLCCK